MWRKKEAAIGHLTSASKEALADPSQKRQILGLKSRVLRETSKSKELAMLLETTADTSRYSQS